MYKQNAPRSASFNSHYRLIDDIPAIQACYGADGRVDLGAITHLPQGAELAFCGDGFNENTLKVYWEGQFYFVFYNDIKPRAADRPARKPTKTETAKILSASGAP
ncbi:MAG: hypothetical protein JOY62_11570 [Acidobacteriaceae bacterium]|nr:hypothetical protein [Acidobacteriaceae bacterium]MBV9780598.1 hypothetical protein [Acidobacteriaceae bacterium]